MNKKKLCVFCGSGKGRGNSYLEMADDVGEFLIGQQWDLVYGGANIGVMGAMANAVLAKGGEVFGVMPKKLAEFEVAHREITALEIVDSMHERKQKMYDLSDGFLALPGGMGTLDELFEILTWSQLKYHRKPIYLWNYRGFFDFLLKHLQHAGGEGFISQEHLSLLMPVEKLAEIHL